VAEYFYNSDGQRVKKNESGTVTYYIGNHYEVVVYFDGSSVNTSYYFANGERAAKRVVNSSDPGGVVYYYHPDHLGSTNVISDSAGTLVETTKYFPFGLIRSGGTADKYGFTGKEFDSETELNYYKARYYSPVVRNFISPDPEIHNLYDPQALNRYSYTLNNPMKYTDPTGKNPLLVYSMVYGALMGAGYMGGVMWGSLEYHMMEYKPETGWNYEREKELVRQRSNQGAALGAAIATGLVAADIAGVIDLSSMLDIGDTTAFETFSVVPDYAGQTFSKSGQLLTDPSQLTEGTDYIFAETAQQEMMVGIRGEMEMVGGTSHAHLVGGENVISAGHIEVINGEYHLYPATGHYQVSQESISHAANYLKDMGVEASKIVIHSWEDYYTSGGTG